MPQLPRITPLAPARFPQPFDHPDWLNELKHDGWRCIAYVERGHVELVSRWGNTYKRFLGLEAALAQALSHQSAIIDGEVVCLDGDGRSTFFDWMRRRGEPTFYAFDVMHVGHRDLRELPLIRRKAILRDLLPSGRNGILVADHVVGRGVDLFRAVCERDCEGIVAKWAPSPYRVLGNVTPWLKIRNPHYSQSVGRHEFFNGFR